MKKLSLITLIATILTLAGCVSSRKVNYLQDMKQNSQIELEHRFEAVIRPYDEITVQITSSDAELTRPFQWNLGTNASNISAPEYLVDVDGNIDLPVLGKLHVDGMTRLQLQDTLTAMLKQSNIISDPFVMVRFKSFKIFFLGATGGKAVTIPNERCTFLEALALAGDINVYTDRSKIAVMREVDGKITTRYLDPRSSTVFNDPYFMLRQNDFIITESRTLKTKRDEVTYWMGWMSSIVSIASLVTTILVYTTLKK
ncbi:MAG: Periplasmic protein involved in polysaccharide export [bacterium P3]|nr:MAG: Periplasmic protein involved in polysaccharide export [bacterium P201]KWW30492.1 MAG: Periplasmic protein involved in polysaccharide export [bacterium P3]KWW41379.1 MAG: Periplasmic protein involved in polysaccharide export [bacterium F083]